LVINLDSVQISAGDTVELTVVFPPNSVRFLSASSFTPTGVNCSKVICVNDSINGQAKIQLIDTSGITCNINGDWTINFKINSCSVINSVVDYKIKFSLLASSSFSNFEIAAFRTFEPIKRIASSLNQIDYDLTLYRPKLYMQSDSLPNGYTSKNDTVVNRYDIVDRYFMVRLAEGITDYFELKYAVEPEMELLRLEAINPNNGSVKQAIFQNDTLNKGLKNNDTLSIYFCNTLNANIVKPNTLALPIVNFNSNKIAVPIYNCITPFTGNAIDSSLANNNTTFNYILVHEKLRMLYAKGCNKPEGITYYQYNQYCEYDTLLIASIDSLEYCSPLFEDLNVTPIQTTDAVAYSLRKRNGNTYSKLNT
jgi:hypothetical protein